MTETPADTDGTGGQRTRSTLRLSRASSGTDLWSEDGVRSLIGQTVALKLPGQSDITVRVTDARIDDGWVVVDTEPTP